MLRREMPPVHPGEILRTLYMEPLEMGVKELAQSLDVTPKTISALVNGHQGVSVEMALRLSRAFNTSADIWINLQKDYDIWKVKQAINMEHVRVLVPAKKHFGKVA